MPIDEELDQVLLLVRADAGHFQRITANLQLEASLRAAAETRLDHAAQTLEQLGRLRKRDQQASEHQHVARAGARRRRTRCQQRSGVYVQLQDVLRGAAASTDPVPGHPPPPRFPGAA